MNQQRFRILETRALYEIGLPAVVLWGALFLQVLLGMAGGGGRRIGLPFVGDSMNLPVCNLILALGFTGVWLLALQWTQTEVVVAPDGLRLTVLGQLQWFLTWPQLTAWAWDWHWTGTPQGLLIVSKTGAVTHLRLGFLGVGRTVGGVVQVYPYYVPLLKALGYYLQGETWHEPPPPKPGKGW
jgi:hypothetical protein